MTQIKINTTSIKNVASNKKNNLHFYHKNSLFNHRKIVFKCIFVSLFCPWSEFFWIESIFLIDWFNKDTKVVPYFTLSFSSMLKWRQWPWSISLLFQDSLVVQLMNAVKVKASPQTAAILWPDWVAVSFEILSSSQEWNFTSSHFSVTMRFHLHCRFAGKTVDQ